MRLEQEIIEIHAVFMDLATMVSQKGDQLNRMEDHVNGEYITLSYFSRFFVLEECLSIVFDHWSKLCISALVIKMEQTKEKIKEVDVDHCLPLSLSLSKVDADQSLRKKRRKKFILVALVALLLIFIIIGRF